MKILSIELVGYKRLKLNQIRRIKLTFKQIIQLILGTNGSGKSSLMEELSPLPANSNDYTKDGHKIIELSNNGHHYLLTSRMSTNKHSFIKDGNELNDGGTISIQRELVKQEFLITQDIFNLMIGHEKFHLMRPTERREWFTALGESNYDYSLRVFAKLRERQRDAQGAIKIAKKRLVLESAKLLDEKEEQAYQTEVDEIHRVVTKLLENRNPNVRPSDEVDADYNSTEIALRQTADTLLSIKVVRPEGCTTDSDIDLEVEIRNIDQDIQKLESLIQQKVKDYDNLEKSYTIMQRAGGAGIKELEERTKPIVAKQLSIRASQTLGLVFEEPENVLNIVDTIDPILYDLLSDFPENKERQYSRLSLEKEQQLQFQKQDEKKRMEIDYNRLHAQKLHLEQHKKEGSVECPKCNHTWIRGYDEAQYQKIEKALGELEQKLENIVKEIRSSEERVTFINEYARKYREYLRTVESTRILAPFWDIIEHQSLITDSPKEILNLVGKLRLDLGMEIEFRALAKEIADINELAKSMQETEASNLEELSKKLEIAQEELGSITHELNQLKTKAVSYKAYRSQIKTCLTYNEEIKRLTREFDKYRDAKIEVLRNNSINYCLRELQLTLANKQKLLSESSIQKGIVQDLKNQIARLEDDEEALKVLINNLSPTDGLIAEGLFGFIRTFIRQMNNIIKKTWSYPLEVVPCGMNDDGGVELDYRFPLVVQTKDNLMPDVSKGSSGMKEIVDLAFKIIAMKYLGLSHAPIYLDEWGKTLDVQHKKSSVESLKSLMEQQSFSQLFIISHDFIQYGSLSNYEVCVLDSTNIIVPGTYNEHVELV